MRNFVIVSILLSFFLVGSMVTESSSLYAAELYHQSDIDSFYYTGFNKPRIFAANSGNISSSSSDFDLGTVHKIFGYSTIATALTAMFAGIMVADAYDHNRSPSATLSGIHRASSVGTVGLAIGSCTTGVLAFSDMISFGDGINSYNSHASLAVLSTIGFIITAAIAPEAEDGSTLKRSDYNRHCTVAKVSGGLLFGTAIVIHF